MYRRILLPVDFSVRSREAADYARRLAERFNAALTFLHVVAPLEYEYSMIEPSDTSLKQIEAKRQEKAKQELDRFPETSWNGVADVERVVAFGDPAEQILAHARSRGTNLILMPTQGQGSLRRLLIGSVSAKVLHDAECPVWTGVHLAERPDFPEFSLKHILCAVDLEAQTIRVLEAARQLAFEFKAKMTVVHATPEPGGDAGDFFDPNWRLHLTVKLRERLDEVLQGEDVQTHIAAGDPHKVVSAAAARFGADLVVIGRGCNTDVVGRLRAHAYAIIRQSPCPVLSV